MYGKAGVRKGYVATFQLTRQSGLRATYQCTLEAFARTRLHDRLFSKVSTILKMFFEGLLSKPSPSPTWFGVGLQCGGELQLYSTGTSYVNAYSAGQGPSLAVVLQMRCPVSRCNAKHCCSYWCNPQPLLGWHNLYMCISSLPWGFRFQ